MKITQSLEIWQFLIKSNIHLLYEPAIPVLGNCSRKMKTHVYPKTCTQMFIAILLKRAQTWKKTQMSINWLMDKQCVSITKNIQQTKTNHRINNVEKNLKSIILTSQTQSPLHAWFHLHKILNVSKLWGQKADTGKVAGVEMEQTAKGIEVLVDEKTFCMMTAAVVIWVSWLQNSLNCTRKMGESYCI